MVHLDDISCGSEVMGTMKTLVPMHKDDSVTGLSKRLYCVLLSDCPLAKSQVGLYHSSTRLKKRIRLHLLLSQKQLCLP